MATSVKVNKLDSTGAVTGTVEFERYEVTETEVLTRQESLVKKSQLGKPTIFLTSDPYYEVQVRVRVHGNSTQSKLNTIRNHAAAAGTFNVYPKMQEDVDVYYTCILSPEIPLDWLFSGQYRGGEIITLNFLESDKTSEVIVTDEIVME